MSASLTTHQGEVLDAIYARGRARGDLINQPQGDNE